MNKDKSYIYEPEVFFNKSYFFFVQFVDKSTFSKIIGEYLFTKSINGKMTNK